MKVEELKTTAAQVRRDIVRMVHGCQSGHPGGSLGCTDLVTALYFHEMKIDESKGADGFLNFSREAKGEDLFFCLTVISHRYFIQCWQDAVISI